MAARTVQVTGISCGQTGALDTIMESHVAEIGIQKKQRSIWPWILGLLILALLVWVAVQVLDADVSESDADIVSVAAHADGRTGGAVAR
ncbi:MAG: hypothetical protein WEF86_04535 [Gemmatimonadota bacterium]